MNSWLLVIIVIYASGNVLIGLLGIIHYMRISFYDDFNVGKNTPIIDTKEKLINYINTYLINKP